MCGHTAESSPFWSQYNAFCWPSNSSDRPSPGPRKDVTLAEGTLALALLIGLQFAVTWSSVRVQWDQQIVKGKPSPLLYQGEFLQEALRCERVTEDEVLGRQYAAWGSRLCISAIPARMVLIR